MSFFSKIILKLLKIKSINDFRKNKNSKVGKDFKIGDYCNFSLHDSAEFAVGNSASIRSYCNFFVGKDAKFLLSDNVFINNFCSINVMESIEIGENTLLGEGVKMYDHNHEYGFYPDFKVDHQKFKTAPIKIGKNCWLGSNVIILKGITIGDNCIIGAGTLIYKDIPANSVIKMKQEHIVSQL